MAERFLSELVAGFLVRSLTPRFGAGARITGANFSYRRPPYFRSYEASFGYPRVLRRRLGSEGFTLTDLREDALRDRACFELLQPEANINNIAERLGYSEPSAFHRAFKRWTGLTPSQFVRDQRRSLS